LSKLDWLESYITVIECNGFAAAAKKLKLSTATISRQIAQLESELRTQLLNRTTRKLSLTETGAQYYAECKKIIQQLTDAEAAISAGQHEATGVLNIFSTPHLCTKLLLPRLAEFMAQNPKLQIKIELGERFPNFTEENVDILFGISLEGPPEVIRQRIYSSRYVLSASPAYLKKYGTPQKISDLSQHRYITHVGRPNSTVLSFKKDKTINVTPFLWLNSTQLMLECAVGGMGITNLHDFVVEDALKNKQLIEILPEYQKPEKDVYLYYKKTNHMTTKVRKFIDFYSPYFK